MQGHPQKWLAQAAVQEQLVCLHLGLLLQSRLCLQQHLPSHSLVAQDWMWDVDVDMDVDPPALGSCCTA